MKIGIFSKFDMAGGSEFRAAEMANAIAKYSNHESLILAEKQVPTRIRDYVNNSVKIIENVVLPQPKNKDVLYEVDSLLVINTDSKDFTTLDYWQGKSTRHSAVIDVSKIKQICFLFNWIVSPSRHLFKLNELSDIRIITTNEKFFKEISDQDRYEMVRHLPRTILRSPIDNTKFDDITRKPLIDRPIRVGMHSKSVGNKWNKEFKDLIKYTTTKYGNKVHWKFMGMSRELTESLKQTDGNITISKEFAEEVPQFLSDLDIFTFYISWSREEPWSRACAEAMVSGLPVLATNKGGNKDQIVHGNNGFLCKSLQDFKNHLTVLIEHPGIISDMARNSRILSKQFHSQEIIRQYINFIDAH